MLHVFVGNDVVTLRKDVDVFLSKEDSGVVRVTVENYAAGILRDYVHAQSLFGGQSDVVVLDFLSEDEVAFEEMFALLKELATSTRTYVVLDKKPKTAHDKALQKYATSYKEVAPKEKETFNTFALADAFARKDKKSLWILLVRARMAGVAPEEVAGVLFWQLKTLRLAAQTRSAEEAGLSEYPYKKAKAAVREFKKGELEELTEKLLTLYHDGHADSDMELGLERFALAL